MFPETATACAVCGRAVISQRFSCPWCGCLHPHLPRPGFIRPVPHTREKDLPTFFPLMEKNRLSVKALRYGNFRVEETTYLSVGGGMGSFAWADYLRVCGAAASQIRIIGQDPLPYARFRQLCANSQINDHERIRSDSGARPDNLWGWPGYAVQEIAEHVQKGRLRDAGRIAWQILAEPALADVFTPCAGQVFAGVEREMQRIGWQSMFRHGGLFAIRQTDDGRFAAAYTRHIPGSGRFQQFIVAPYLHIALGYPGIHLAPETQAYRDASLDLHLVVQAYEEHEHIYRQLAQRGGMVIIRGRGIVSSRILQRLDEIRQTTGRNIQIVHLLRSPLTEDTVYGPARRVTRYHMQWQPYNFPKAVFGGDLRFIFAEASPAERQKLVANWGGVTSSDRTDWQEVMARGTQEGWYRVCFGAVEKLQANGRGRVIAHLCTQELPDVAPQPSRLVADFVIDCTGLNTNIKTHSVLNDLQQRYHLPLNPFGRLAVNDDFELEGLRNGDGRAFMAGVMAFGNHFAPVDSFAGLQFAAQRSLEALVRADAPGLRQLDGLTSVREWWRWARNVEPLAVGR